MGITRSGLHKKRPSGGKRHIHRKKRKFELGRQSAATKLVVGQQRIRRVRVRGGNSKFRALRLDAGNFSWGSETITRRARILDVVYNATSNELVRTKTLVKGCIVQIDATPFNNWYYKWYGVTINKTTTEHKPVKSSKKKEKEEPKEEKKADLPDAKPKKAKVVSKSSIKKWGERAQSRKLDTHLETELATGKVLAKISSRPGQVGRADGYILEGKELDFYQKKLDKKKKKLYRQNRDIFGIKP